MSDWNLTIKEEPPLPGPLWMEPSPAQLAEWRIWTANWPDDVRVVAERFNPWTLYRLRETGQICTIVSFGTLNAGTPEEHIGVVIYAQMPHRELGPFTGTIVLGVHPDSLEPWPEGEEHGMTAEQISAACIGYVSDRNGEEG